MTYGSVLILFSPLSKLSLWHNSAKYHKNIPVKEYFQLIAFIFILLWHDKFYKCFLSKVHHTEPIHLSPYGEDHGYASPHHGGFGVEPFGDHGQVLGAPHIHPPPPLVHHKEEDKDKKKPKKAEQIHQVKDDVAPDIKIKLREMLTAELNKKLDELNLAPTSSSATKSADATIKGKSTGDSNERDSNTNLSQGSSNPNAYSSESSKQTASSSSIKLPGSTLAKLSRQQKQFSSSSKDNEEHKGSSNPNNNEGDDVVMVNNVADDEKIPSAKKVKNANSQFGSDQSESGSSSSNNDQSDFLEEKSLLAKGIKKAKGTAVTGVLRSKGIERKADRCKRYRILKNGKKLKLKFHKKDCVESVR